MTSMMVTHAERFWMLANATAQAEYRRDEGDEQQGYSSALRHALRIAIGSTLDDTITATEGMSKAIAREMTGMDDPYYDGYQAGIARAVTILKGGK